MKTPESLLSVTADQPGERLDVAVARLCDLSRAQARRLIDEGEVLVDGKSPGKAGVKLMGGETVAVRIPPPEPALPTPEDIPLAIVYEDEHLIVVDKPAGMPVHPGPGHSEHTLVNALLWHCPDLPGIGGVQRPGIVHRLDKDTSGLIVVAKDERAHAGLTRQLSERRMHKTYLALVEGRLDPPEAIIDAPIGRDPNNRQRQTILHDGRGREAQTRYKVREYLREARRSTPTSKPRRSPVARTRSACTSPLWTIPSSGMPSTATHHRWSRASSCTPGA